MRYIAPTILLFSCLLLSAGVLGLTGCMAIEDGSLVLSPPASESSVAEGRQMLAEEQEQRQDADEAMRVDMGKVEVALRADVSAALEAYETSPAEAQAMLAKALSDSKTMQRDAVARLERLGKKQREDLAEKIDSLDLDGGMNQELMLLIMGVMGVGGLAGGKKWGHSSERKTNGKVT